MRKLVVILGIPIDNLNMEETLDRIEKFIEIGRATGKGHQVATINTDFVVKAFNDPELRHLLQEADLATADGMPLVWGARLLGVPLEERVAGADMVPALAERAAKKGYSLYFLGAGPGVATRAADILKQRSPGLKIAGIHSPPKSPVLEMDDSIIADIKAVKPDVLLVAFGNPKQEKWIGMYGRTLNVPVMIGIGGTLDFIAGETHRAPPWMQKIGMEWFYRLMQEPQRLWRRYIVDFAAFSYFYVLQWWFMLRGRVPAPLLPTTDAVIVDDIGILNVNGRIDLNNSQELMGKGQNALQETPKLIMNLSETTFIDSSGIGTLIGLTKQARDAGGDVMLAAVPEFVRRVLALMRLDNFFEFLIAVEDGLKHPKFSIRQPKERIETRGMWTIYRMPRRVDAITTPEIHEAISALLNQNVYLIIDFSETVFLASAGLAALIQLNRQANELGGELRLSGCSKDVSRVIKMVRIDKVLSIYQDVAAAVAQ